MHALRALTWGAALCGIVAATSITSLHQAKADDYPEIPQKVVDVLANADDIYMGGNYDHRSTSMVRHGRNEVDSNRTAADPISQSAAIADAASDIGIDPASPVVGATLTTVSTPDDGIDQQTDPSQAPQIIPDFSNASCWAIDFSSLQIPLANEDPNTGLNYYTTDFVVFVDAYSGVLFLGSDAPSVGSRP